MKLDFRSGFYVQCGSSQGSRTLLYSTGNATSAVQIVTRIKSKRVKLSSLVLYSKMSELQKHS